DTSPTATEVTCVAAHPAIPVSPTAVEAPQGAASGSQRRGPLVGSIPSTSLQCNLFCVLLRPNATTTQSTPWTPLQPTFISIAPSAAGPSWPPTAAAPSCCGWPSP